MVMEYKCTPDPNVSSKTKRKILTVVPNGIAEQHTHRVDNTGCGGTIHSTT